MAHSSSSFRKNVIQHFQHLPKSILHCCDKPLSRTIMKRLFLELGNGVSEALRKSFQRRIGLGVVHELVEITRQSIKCMSTNLAKSINTVIVL